MEKAETNNQLPEHGTGHSGFYRGVVRKQLDGGRCKIFIPGVYDDKYEPMYMADFLPDAEQASPLFAKSIEQSGSFSMPDVGAIVWVFFANEDVNYPVYFASTLNTFEGMGKASWNRGQEKKKYWQQIFKNGPAEIVLDEHSRIELNCLSEEGGVQKNQSQRPASIVIDRDKTTNRIILRADDVVIECKNFLVKAINSEIDSACTTHIKARGGMFDVQATGAMINVAQGQGTNMISLKSSTGAQVI